MATDSPLTPAGRKLLESWRLVPEYGPPNTVVIRDAIIAIEEQSRAEAEAELLALRSAVGKAIDDDGAGVTDETEGYVGFWMREETYDELVKAWRGRGGRAGDPPVVAEPD